MSETTKPSLKLVLHTTFLTQQYLNRAVIKEAGGDIQW